MHVAQRFKHVENIKDINFQHRKFDSDRTEVLNQSTCSYDIAGVRV